MRAWARSRTASRLPSRRAWTSWRTLVAVRADRPRSAAERRAKRLAIAGVRAWLRGLESQIAFVENDSGNLPVATRDAKRAYHARLVGANLLRRAGDLLGIHIGMLSGF